MKAKTALVDDDIVTRPGIDRRSALAKLGVAAGVGALSAVLGGCAAIGMDLDPSDAPGAPSGRGWGGGGGGGGGSSSGGGGSEGSYRTVDADYPIYADFRDLDPDARDRSDHGRARSADAK